MPEPKMASNCFKYNFALVSRISNSFKDQSSFGLKQGESIDITKARHEHEELVEALRRIGLDVIELPCDEKHPDGLFVNDIAVVINGTALICNPPSFPDRPSRQGELAVVRQVLRKELGLKIVEVDSDKAVVEGSDVLWTGRDIFVGISNRTNLAGAQAVAKAFPEYPTHIMKVHPPAVHLQGRDIIVGVGQRTNEEGAQVVARTFPEYPTVMVEVPPPAVHLTDYITMAGPEVMAVSNSLGAQKTFSELRNTGVVGYRYITVDEDEAANVLYCNGTLVHLASDQIPKGFATFENKIDYPRVAIHMQEPLKRGGRLHGCVLLIARVKHPKKIPTSA